MKNRFIELLVGIFVAFGLGALLMLALKVSNIDSFKDAEGYEVSAVFEAVGGLKEKAPVTVAGVRVGRVKSIELDSIDYQARVVLMLEPELMPLHKVDAEGEPMFEDDGSPVNCKLDAEDCMMPLFADASASILTAGLLGEQYIGLNVGGGAPNLLPVGDEIRITQSAIVLEQIIGQFLFSKASEREDDKKDE